MRTPPLLLSAALLFWGWQTGWLPVAAGMAAVVEGARFVPVRWDFSSSDINRVSDLCTIILAMAVIVAFNLDARHFVMITFRWLPLIGFPLMVVQMYGKAATIRLSALLALLRRKKIGYRLQARTVNLSYPYLCLCIVATAAANGDKHIFFAALLVLLAWALWPLRSRRYHAAVWLVILALGAGMGFGLHVGLYRLQTYIMSRAYDFFFTDNDPFKRVTAIGDIVSLKPSSRILFRVGPAAGTHPLLLREAAYTLYDGSKWYATHAAFRSVAPESNDTTWEIAEGTGASDTLQVYAHLSGGRHLLKLPGGTFELDRLDAESLRQNRFGAVRIESKSGLMHYQVKYDPTQAFNAPPDDDDLQVPEEEAAALQKIAQALGLDTLPATRVLAALNTFFLRNFNYSLDLTASASGSDTALAHFLLAARRGHCEYFATATVLLLRAAGIPARYVSGYAATEYSKMEEMIIVRQRHAHAWALAYVGGRWVDVDNTPPDWAGIEAAGSSPLTLVTDFFSYLRFQFILWRDNMTQEQLTRYLIIPLVILLVLFVRRLTGKKDMKRVAWRQRQGQPAADAQAPVRPFHAVEAWLRAQGFEKQPGQTLGQWIADIDRSAPAMMLQAELHPLLRLHYRDRFSRGGLTVDEHQSLARGVEAFIASRD